MDDEYRPLYDRGLGLAEQFLGPAWAERVRRQDAPFGNELAQMIVALVYGGVWSRDGLSLRDRSLITLAVHIARERPEEMRIHIPVGLQNGLTREEIEELFIQVGAYAGFPAAANCNRVAQEVFGEQDAATSRGGDR